MKSRTRARILRAALAVAVLGETVFGGGSGRGPYKTRSAILNKIAMWALIAALVASLIVVYIII
jgi:hypothetical protein